MTRRAYLKRRARRLRHGDTRNTHGARRRRRIADTVRRLGGKPWAGDNLFSKYVSGVDLAVGQSFTGFSMAALGAAGAIHSFNYANYAAVQASLEHVRRAANLSPQAIMDAVQAVAGFERAVVTMLEPVYKAVRDFFRAVREGGEDPYAALERAGADPKVVEALRAAETVWRLTPEPESSLGLSITLDDQASPAFAQLRAQCLTVNEVRETLGLPAIEDGDRLL